MEIKEMNLEQLSEQKEEIRSMLNNEDADLDALTARLDEIEARESEIKESAEKRNSLLEKVGNEGKVVEVMNENTEIRVNGVDSVEYRDAFWKLMAGNELSAEENRTLTTGITGTTSGTATDVSSQSLLVPTETLNYIWDLVTGRHAILDDIQIYRSGVVMTIPVHTAGSGASIKAEGVAPSEESNTFAKVTLAGKDFAKYVELSYAMERMSIPALAQYVADEIAKALGDALAKEAVDAIIGGVASANKFSDATPEYADICGLFGACDRVDDVVIYAKRNTIYTKLIGMVDSNKRPIFQLAPAEGAVGTILGAPVKVEDAVPAGAILIGDGNQAVMNIVQDIMIENDKDIKKHVTTYSGYARAEAALVNDKAFAYLTTGSVSA